MTAKQIIKQFYEKWYFPCLAAALIAVGNLFGLELLSVGLTVALLIPGFFVCRDLRFIILPVLALFFTVSVEHTPSLPSYSFFFTEPRNFIPLAFFLIVFFAGIVCFCIRNRDIAKSMPRGGSFVPILVFCAALLFNGFFNQTVDAPMFISNVLFALTFAVSLLLFYYLFGAYFRFDETAPGYLMNCLVLCGLIVCVELIGACFRNIEFVGFVPVKESVLVGWGIWTSIGGMLAMLLPAPFYFAATAKHGWIGYLIAVSELFCILLSQGRGALLIGGFLFVVCAVTVCCFGAYRKRNIILTVSIAVVGIAGVIILRDRFMDLIANFMEKGLSDNGRLALWKEGISDFLHHPVFGAGFFDSYVDPAWSFRVYPYFYHNTLIQILASCGVIGFAAYVWHRVRFVRQVLHAPDLRKTFFAYCIIGLLLASLIDVMFFVTYPMIYYALMLLAIDRCCEAGR